MSYDDLVEEFGHEIVLSERLGDYQGDYLFLLYANGAYGFLVQGYGSCSMCDVLEGIEMDTNSDAEYEREVEELKSAMHNSIVWYPAEQMIDYLSNDAEGFFLYESAWESFCKESVQKIRERAGL